MKKGIFLFLLLALVFITWIFWANTALEVTHVTVASEQLPEAFENFRIAHISDLHNAEFGEGNDELLSLLRAQQPDIIVITGDLVDSRRTDLEIALAFVREAVKIAPVYLATGNHEAGIPDFDDYARQLREAGCVILRNESILIAREDAAIRLTGLDDYLFFPGANGHACVLNMLAELDGKPSDGFDVVLFHRPELAHNLRGRGIELVLSGHAHGGQVRLPLLGGLYAPDQGWFPEYDEGMYLLGDMALVVSRGLGNSVFPLRFNNRPEVVIITLEKG